MELRPFKGQQVQGYAGHYINENIAKGYYDITDVMRAWKNSPDHCAAMMHPLNVEMGAYRYNGYWVQEFGH
jgi:uncharacterized protein YkwD